MNEIRTVRRLLYKLKREYGKSITLYVQGETGVDLTRGTRTITRTPYYIQRAPVVSLKYFSQGFYSPAYLKSAKLFAFGGYQEMEFKNFIIDAADIPAGFEITPDMYIAFEHSRFEIANVESLEHRLGYVITGKRLVGVEVDEIHTVNVTQTIRFLQEATDE